MAKIKSLVKDIYLKIKILAKQNGLFCNTRRFSKKDSKENNA
jgi:hypothetical protein